MKRVLKYFLLTLLWIIFPPLFIYIIAKNKDLKRGKKIGAYFSVIASPFTICYILFLAYEIETLLPRKYPIESLEKNLGVRLPLDYIEVKNTLTCSSGSFDGECLANVIITFSERGLGELTDSLQKSRYFNLRYKFANINLEEEWEKSDTAFYKTVRSNLARENLTGYWIRSDDFTYQFYEPGFFMNDFFISATLSIKDRTLNYKFEQD